MRNKIIRLLCLIFLLVVLILYESKVIFLYAGKNNIDPFRKLEIHPEILEELSDQYGYGSDLFFSQLTKKMLDQNFSLVNKKQLNKKIYYITIFANDMYQEYYRRYQTILKDIQIFPVKQDPTKKETLSFDNSWWKTRNYGGKRFHEGTDIMTSNNKRGYFKVVSMTNGVIEQMGWLEKGGYRIGIRSESGGYFYYAHLHEYRIGLKKGDHVKAGEVIGTMGDSGYSKIEGTVGNFDVHLHLGIYLDEQGQEISINPYYILKYLATANKFS